MQLTEEEWELLRDGWADVSCWFMGFSAARGDDPGIRYPPQLRELSDLVETLKRRALETK